MVFAIAPALTSFTLYALLLPVCVVATIGLPAFVSGPLAIPCAAFTTLYAMSGLLIGLSSTQQHIFLWVLIILFTHIIFFIVLCFMPFLETEQLSRR